jgi:hypothetical protein
MLLLLLCSATRFKDFGLGWWRRLGGSGAGLFDTVTTLRIDDAVLLSLLLGKGKSRTTRVITNRALITYGRRA